MNGTSDKEKEDTSSLLREFQVNMQKQHAVFDGAKKMMTLGLQIVEEFIKDLGEDKDLKYYYFEKVDEA